jgi:hypothetical protein
MVRKYKNKEEIIQAFKHALGARDAFAVEMEEKLR